MVEDYRSPIKEGVIQLSKERITPRIDWEARAQKSIEELPPRIIWQCVYCKTTYFVQERCPNCGARESVGRAGDGRI